ncbi:hypothetical protein D4R75_06610 [bacterium]|nr:MAG: hypothetical protein D4R75_06610 [bacterium]
MNMKVPLFRLGVLLPFLVFYALGQSGDLPSELGTLKLTKTLQGNEARAFINRLHEKDVTPKNSVRGEYGGGKEQATLYVSIYELRSKAAEAAKRMTRLISKGNRVFGQYKELKHGQLMIGRCEGLGQIHYFFLYRDRVFWLAADSSVAGASLESLVRSVAGKAAGP